MYEQATQFAMTVLRTARDWQDAQHALADHPRFGPWLTDTFGDGDIAEAQAIIREAEARLEDEDVDAMTHALDAIDLDADLSRRDCLREEAE